MSIRNYKIYFIGIFSSIILLNVRNVVINIRSAKNLFLFKQFMKKMAIRCRQITIPKTPWSLIEPLPKVLCGLEMEYG